MIEFTERDIAPSEELHWTDLDEAVLLIVVAPDYSVRMYAEEAHTPAQHAAMLRDLADRLDPA